MNRYDLKKSAPLFTCPECQLTYADRAWAKKCAAWCKAHHSCNLEITRQAVNKQAIGKAQLPS